MEAPGADVGGTGPDLGLTNILDFRPSRGSDCPELLKITIQGATQTRLGSH